MHPSQYIIDQCRKKQARTAGWAFRPEARLFKYGKLVWGCVVKANRALYAPGKVDLPGCAIFSFDPYSDAHADELEAIRAIVFRLRGTAPQEPDMREFARIVSEDYAVLPRTLVPSRLTNGREVWYEEISFVRARLPAGYLVARLLPVIADATALRGIMLPPLNCWAEELVEDWSAKAAKIPPGVKPPPSNNQRSWWARMLGK